MNLKNSTYEKFSKNDTYVTGIYEANILSDIFFSDKNIELIQTKIIKTINDKYKYKISKQSNNELFIIMRAIYMDHSTNNYKNKNDIKKEIQRLNILIINHCVNNIINNIKEHVEYIKKIDNPSNIIQIDPINRPQNVNKKGDNTLEFKSFF